MAISETTRNIAVSQRRQLQQTMDANTATIAEYKAIIIKLEAENEALKSKQDALKADIPEPTLIEEPLRSIR